MLTDRIAWRAIAAVLAMTTANPGWTQSTEAVVLHCQPLSANPDPSEIHYLNNLKHETATRFRGVGIYVVTDEHMPHGPQEYANTHGVAYFVELSSSAHVQGVLLRFRMRPASGASGDDLFSYTVALSGKCLSDDLAKLVREVTLIVLPTVQVHAADGAAEQLMAYCIWPDQETVAGLSRDLTVQYAEQLRALEGNDQKAISGITMLQHKQLCESGDDFPLKSAYDHVFFGFLDPEGRTVFLTHDRPGQPPHAQRLEFQASSEEDKARELAIKVLELTNQP